MHYNGANSYLFVNGAEIIKFKEEDSKIVASPLRLGNISEDWSTNNMRNNWSQRFWCKVVKNWQKVVQKHWYLLHWVHCN